MTFFETVSNVLTLGGTSRVRQWNEKLRAALEQNQDVVSQIGSKKNDLQQAILRLGALTRRACGFLHRSRRLLRPLVRTKRPFIQIAPSDSFTSLTAHPMEQRIDNFYTTGALALGAGTGTTAALGAWTIVSSLGAASTGTAIAGLQGAASANAITAWFGGGALKAGGLGMAGGTVVLTGVVVVPLVGISAYLTHRHANELKGREQEVRSAIKKNTAIYAEIRTGVRDWRQCFYGYRFGHR